MVGRNLAAETFLIFKTQCHPMFRSLKMLQFSYLYSMPQLQSIKIMLLRHVFGMDYAGTSDINILLGSDQWTCKPLHCAARLC